MNFQPEAGAGTARQLDNRTLWEQVRDRLREDILAGRLEPGTELSEVALAKDFGTSRGPLREALGRLASEGLVTITPRRGAVVAQLSREEFIDAYQVREALETLAVRLAVPLMSDAEIAHLRELCELMDRAARDERGARLLRDQQQLPRGARARVAEPEAPRRPPHARRADGPLPAPLARAAREPAAVRRRAPGDPGRDRGARRGARGRRCSRSTSRCPSGCSSPTPERGCSAKT